MCSFTSQWPGGVNGRLELEKTPHEHISVSEKVGVLTLGHAPLAENG